MDEAWRAELAELIAIPSVSADPAHRDDVKRAGEWVCDLIRRIGGTAELTPFGERELVLGEIRASNGAGDAPTVLVYNHFDVQPPAPLELWESDPFELDVRGEWAYGRGVTDDKGQLWLVLRAAQRLVEAGAPRFLVTSIARDGTLEGPDVRLYRKVLSLSEVPVIASGGVRNADDVWALRDLGCEAVVTGKALYEKTLKLSQVSRG